MAFRWENERLGTFFGLWLHSNEIYKLIWRVIICEFIVEHGFTIIENLMVEISKQSLFLLIV